MPYTSIAISSGHGKYVRGASGILDEVDEARRVVERVAQELASRNVLAHAFHDNTSSSQDENLETIVDWHNSQDRQLDVSVHFNAYEQTSSPRGVEVLYFSEFELADELSEAISVGGELINRGAKQETGLYFLNNTVMPAVLLEVCFVDSSADAQSYTAAFDAICSSIADVIGGPLVMVDGEPVPPRRRPLHQGRVDLQISGNVVVTINGVVVNNPANAPLGGRI